MIILLDHIIIFISFLNESQLLQLPIYAFIAGPHLVFPG